MARSVNLSVCRGFRQNTEPPGSRPLANRLHRVWKLFQGDGVNCTRDLNECVCRGETCTCFKGFTGIDCAIEDGTVCTGPSTPSDGCGNTCPAVSCRCERGWEGPSCNFVDDGSSCFSGVGSPPHCEECFIGDSPPCICEKGWQGIRCENDYLPPVFVSCPPDIFMKAGSGEDRAVVTWDDPRAVDNSGAEPNIVCDRTSGSWFSGTSLVTCTASDGTGNSVSDCIFNVTVTDEKAPVMTCPASGSWNVDSGADVATVIWSPLPEATDNIDGKLQVTCTDALGNVVNSGDEFLVGETSVFCLASDKSGNQGRCGFSITVVDNEGPIVTCPSSVTQNVETGKADAAVKWSPLPSAEDAVEGPVPTVVCTDEGGKAAESGNRFPAGNTMVTCSAMDSVGNKGNCSFLIIILDNEAPIMTCPDDIVRNVDAGKAVATVDWPIMPQANDTVDGLLAVTCSDGSGGLVSSGDEFPVDVTMVTCTASDTSHNEGTCSFLITVIDNEDPFIACPENIFQDLDAGSDVGTVHWPTQPSANDTVDGSLAVTCTDDSGIVVKSGDTFSVGATIVTCKAIDGSGNEANCSFTINLKDVEGPVVTCPKDSRQNVEPGRASAAVDWSPSPSAEDVVDGLVPNLTCKAEDGKLVESGGRFPVGKTKITCLAVDSARNEGNCSFVITVVDNESPVFTCLISNITENVSPGLAIGIIHWPSVPFANDTVDGPVAVSCFDSLGKLVSSGDPFAVGVTVVTCKASDSSGNEASCRFTITVIDNEGPVMTCPRNVSQDLDPGSSAGVVVWPTLPLASDTVDGFLTVTCENDSGDPVSSGDEFPVGVTVVTCEATDDSGNKGRCDFAITVKDNEDPVVTCPNSSTQNVEPGKADAAVDWSPSPSAEDNVDGLVPNVTCVDKSGKTIESGGRFPAGDTTITCLAVDSSQNEGNCTFFIKIKDNEAPVMTCPGNMSSNVDSGSAVGTIHWPTVPSANDTVDGPLPVTCKDDTGRLVSSGDEFPVGATTVKCEAADSSGNQDRCSFVVTVTDSEAPEMTCPKDIIQAAGPGETSTSVDWPTLPTANDTVDGLLTVTCSDDLGRLVSSGDAFPIGITVVTCRAADDSDNEANCSFAITVPECGDEETCQNGGTFLESFCNCSCPSPYTGKTCTACEPCQNGGHSQDPDTCACQCPEVYAGLLCSECKECVNGGNQDKDTCVCDCFNSYMGVLCDVCPPDIKCDNAGQFEEAACRCNCPPPWTGPTCSECIPCAHGGTDQDPDTCLCDCPGAYLPPVCAACGGQAECQNGGEFSEVSCNCTCPSPFTGKTCTECEPCQNGGSYQNKFMCVCDCPYFHTDPLCAVCPLGFVCLNGGTRREATCSCECANGWRAKDCSERVPNVPDDEYPVSPIWTVVKKKVSFEIAVIAPIYNGTVCDPRISKFSDACIALVTEFKLSVEIEYKFVAGFSQVVINQEDLRAGSVVVPHEVIYNYEEMTPTTRGISANALYGETVGKAVVRGYIGKLKVATGCEDCMAPQDHTYICDAEPPECAPGLMLTERAEGGEGTCYYVCRSKCKLDTTYCGDGTCRQEQGSKDISCSCPQSSAVMYSGAKCQNQVQLTWLYVGVSVGVVSILVLIVVLSVCLWRSKGLVDRLQEEDEEKVVLGKPMSDELMKELNSYCNNNNGSTGETYFHKPPSGESTRPSLYAQISQEHKRNRAIKNGQAPGAGSGAKVGGLRAHLSPGSPKYEAQIKPNDFDGSRSPRGERRPWYFWGKMSLPKKRDIKMIPMTSETGRF
ncbi:hyalin-like isoform X2 [Acanthaster planci]|uniref:Hyalin-like isoform X2 n=1 Tax=Acanthaster planci TaxID=133434 RepID=A0A8B8A7H4_ACAPL|nr:hyalin-like isoform X2 [Acanthaster planci]